MSSDYTTVGHVTADVLADGSTRAGGGAFYSALQAARLGWRAKIITRGVRAEIEELLAPYRSELELEVIDAPSTTTLATRSAGASHSQRMLAWAGEIGDGIAVEADLLHLAPVARETPARWQGSAGFVGATPQGLVRAWSGAGAAVVAVPLDLQLMPARCDAVVISESERESCSSLLGNRERTGVIAVTHGAAPAELLLAGGEIARVNVEALQDARDDIGAGDVFAAAFFIALSEGAAPRAAAAFGNAAAAVRLAGEGPGAIGERAAIEQRAAGARLGL